MALIFADGFDNYGGPNLPVTPFWDTNGNDVDINITPGIPRTGRGCLNIKSAAFGPIKSFGADYTHILFCTAFNVSAEQAPRNLMRFMNSAYGGIPIVGVVVNPSNGAIEFTADPGSPGPTVSTPPGVYHFGAGYQSVAVEIENFTNTTGIITCWVNGVMVYHQTGLNTRYGGFANPAFCSGVQLMGAGGIPAFCYHDDFYALDCSVAPNNTFLGALKLYSIPPTANGAVAWAPLAGSNWSEVNEVPPDDDTSYNSSGNIGDVDQYVYPLTGPPANSSLLFVQHELDMKVDSGSRSVASDVAGVVNASATALGNAYHIYPTPYDLNPSTGLPWVAGDFPLNAGPKVTA
jgi:hypothetical protein